MTTETMTETPTTDAPILTPTTPETPVAKGAKAKFRYPMALVGPDGVVAWAAPVPSQGQAKPHAIDALTAEGVAVGTHALIFQRAIEDAAVPTDLRLETPKEEGGWVFAYVSTERGLSQLNPGTLRLTHVWQRPDYVPPPAPVRERKEKTEAVVERVTVKRTKAADTDDCEPTTLVKTVQKVVAKAVRRFTFTLSLGGVNDDRDAGMVLRELRDAGVTVIRERRVFSEGKDAPRTLLVEVGSTVEQAALEAKLGGLRWRDKEAADPQATPVDTDPTTLGAIAEPTDEALAEVADAVDVAELAA